MNNGLKQYLNGFFSLIYPDYCPACGNALLHNEKLLCLRCLIDLPRTRFHELPENDVARIFWGRLMVENATSFIFFTKDSRYRQILHEIKYQGQKELAYELGKMFGLELKDTAFSSTDLIHPVPLHPARLRQRGYNQSELIAAGMSEILKIPLASTYVKRKVPTRTQTRKTRYERWENVRNTFCIPDPELLIDKHILLVDDVITTGATIEACASTLLSLKGVKVSIASLAYVKLH